MRLCFMDIFIIIDTVREMSLERHTCATARNVQNMTILHRYHILFMYQCYMLLHDIRRNKNKGTHVQSYNILMWGFVFLFCFVF